MKQIIITVIAALLSICGTAHLQAQVLKVADLEKYAKERYGDNY